LAEIDRASMPQCMVARIFGQIADLPMAASDNEVRVH
jgi:hypothetical protein